MPRQVKTIIKDIDRQYKAIEQARDKLRDIESEVASLADDYDDALQSLEEATEVLSRFV